MKFITVLISLVAYDALLTYSGLILSQKYGANYAGMFYFAGYLIPFSIGALWLGRKVFKDFYPTKLFKEIDTLKSQLYATQADYRNHHGEGYYQAVNEMNLVIEVLRDENKILRDAVSFGMEVFKQGYMYNVFARALRLARNSHNETTAAKLKTEIALMSNDHQMVVANLNDSLRLRDEQILDLKYKLDKAIMGGIGENMRVESMLFGGLNAIDFIKEVGILEFESMLSRLCPQPLKSQEKTDA